MIDPAQVCTLLHDLGEKRRRRIGRAVIGNHNYIALALVARAAGGKAECVVFDLRSDEASAAA